MFEKCDCGKKAVWMYAPSSGKDNPFYCDDCVPRGCSCNHHYLAEDEYDDSPTEDDDPIKWIEKDKIWCHIDEQGREYPCIEYWYDEDGFEKD